MRTGSFFGSLLDLEWTAADPHTSLVVFNFVAHLAPWRSPGVLPGVRRREGARDFVLTPFRRAQLDIRRFWEFLSQFAGPFEAAMGVPPVWFFSTWIGLHRFLWDLFRSDERHYHEAQLTGFVVTPGKEQLVGAIAAHVKDLSIQLGKPIADRRLNDAVRNSLEALERQVGPAVDLRLADERGVILFAEHQCLVDITEGHELLQFVVEAVRGLKGEYGDRKGKAFEEDVRREFRATYPKAQFWRRAEETLQAPDGRQAEFDLGVLHGNCLILVEAKAYSVRTELLVGERRAVDRRWSEIRDSVRQVHTHVLQLADFPRTDSYRVPDSVRYLIGVSCTALPEWVPTLDANYWLSKDVPRCCTPSELAQLIKRTRPARLSALPFAVEIRGS